MGKYLEQFNRYITVAKKSLIEALTLVILQYAHPLDELPPAVHDFYYHLLQITNPSSHIGQIVMGYRFENTFPGVLLEVVEEAKKLELQALIQLKAEKSRFPLVIQCENEMAAAGYSAESIFAQTVILERAVALKKIDSPSHLLETQKKIIEMINLLYYKFSEMILESSSLEKLEKTIAEKFSDSLSQDLPELSKFKNNIAAQIHFLSLKNFFTFYYEKSELADKYDFVKDFYDQFKKNKEELPVESKAILSYLFYLIVETAWKPVKSQKFNLMDLPDGTVRKVFDDLDVWVKLHYVSFQNRMLFKEIAIKLQKEKHQFKLWEEASHRLFDTAATYRTYEPLMRDLYTMQYCNIQETPEKLLEKLPAPVLFFDYVKPKKQPCHQPICVKKTARCGLDFLVSYLCQEGELFFDESEKNNQEKTHQGFSA